MPPVQGLPDPTLRRALLPAGLLSALLYARPPSTEFIFDETEAIRGNPYVRAAADPAAGIGWLDAFHRDFWGLTPEKTIATYRPVPNLVWRAMWALGLRDQSAFAYHLPCVLLHGLNGALLAVLALRWTRDRTTAWLAGALFVATAVVTEAVSGSVGLADVAAGTGALLALLALDLPLRSMAIAIAAATTLGLYAKESALCLVPLVPLAVAFTPRATPEADERRGVRALVAAAATVVAFVAYVELRRHLFLMRAAPGLSAAFNADKPLLDRAVAAALRWYGQPTVVRDGLVNPLAYAPAPLRVAGGLRIYASGLGQVLVPWTLSADYSSQQETAPREVVSLGSAAGALAMLFPVVLAGVAGFRAWRLRRAGTRADGLLPVVAFALLWMVVAYFPVSNVPVALPTVRAERFFYLPAIGSALVLAIGAARLLAEATARRARAAGLALVGLFLAFQALAARRHALDYRSALAFWSATCEASPRSAKAHLGLGAILGTQGDREGQLAQDAEALRLAPRWAPANVHEGEALCRLHRIDDAIPYLVRGLDAAPGDEALAGLAIGCLSDEQALAEGSHARTAMESLAQRRPTSRVAAALRDAVGAPTVPAQ
jgi:tetratricopeptide (TPR) repeat protein